MFWIGLLVVQRHQRQGPRPPHAPSRLQRTSGQTLGAATAVRRQAKKHAEIPRLKLNRIERARPPFDPEVRNIFGSIDRSSLPSSLPATPQATAPPPTPPPPDPFREEAKEVRFLGYAEADGKPIAFVAYGDEALVVPETEVFGSRFRVKSVKEDSLILTSLDGAKEILLRLRPGSAGALPSKETQRGKRP